MKPIFYNGVLMTNLGRTFGFYKFDVLKSISMAGDDVISLINEELITFPRGSRYHNEIFWYGSQYTFHRTEILPTFKGLWVVYSAIHYKPSEVEQPFNSYNNPHPYGSTNASG